MRPLFNGAGAAGLFCLSFVAAAVQAAEWNGSYSSDGACYCSGTLNSALARRMAPTPIGGQSIAQICSRIGEGPGLEFSGARFSQAVYLDAQCGNGPFALGTRPISDSCAGAYDLAGKDCVGTGPRWDMAAAYGRDAGSLSDASGKTEPRVRYVGGSAHSQPEETINRSAGSVYRKVAQSAGKAVNEVKDVLAANAQAMAAEPGLGAALDDNAAQNGSDGSESLPIIDLAGVQYQLAPEGTAIKGGAPGSRIILDGRLYLRYVEGQMPKPKRAELPAEQVPAEKSPTEKPAVATAPQPGSSTGTAAEPVKAAARRTLTASERAAKQQKALEEARASARMKAAARAEQRAAERAAMQDRGRRQAEADKAAALAASSRAANAEVGEAARQARTEKLLADARERLQRRKARERAEAEAQAVAAAEAESERRASLAAQGNDNTRTADDSRTGLRDSNTLAGKRSDPAADSIEVKTGPEYEAPLMADNSSMTSDEAQRAVDETSAAVSDGEGQSFVPALVNALRMPPETRTSSREFAYVDAMPISYDFGGGGIAFEASATNSERIRYLARLGVASEYQEVLIGASYVLTPARADRMTLIGTVGFEAGQFALEASDVSTEYDDTGVHVGLASRLVLNNKFELQGGIGYSSFFGGDLTATAGGFYHINRQLDIVSRFELGDNDSLGIGVRYYY